MLQKTLAQSRAYDPELSGVYNKLLQEVFFRLDGSMQGFFRRVQAGEKPGRGFFSFLTCGQSPNAGLSNSSQGGEKVERRKDTGAPVVALVGYTNAGKSTLLNRLASANGLAEDKLFATLDPMTRRVRLAGGQEFLLTDTVGFVQRLPTTLVAAFRATLEEVAEDDLLGCISAALQAQFVALDVLIPYDRGDLVALLHQYGTIEYESYEECGTHLHGHIPTNHYGQFAAFRRTASKSLRA